ncbi:transcriptional regulator, BadM/Rrf2 family [Zhouia amylolytica]|uniref:Transcriptional regulator, BadM/Rrf2 family n=2 Tax=Zhouia amylolytica TaxID=376730 RepID=A0A1I6U0L3_9FLAO|nr:Rrf2 family transcriptional regulator [Zhouia amylolytica]ETN96766.1 rrf2 family protein, putative transcriptional regulator [Zhouia amylolytica AD3]MCQ0111119.1 Rrf2 family transcriptional regulator [Zhouia amylolytica]SFS94934.1 transcriptional regulator, BadM/Rrf2 family [Zhouia amylolytica]
MLSKKTKYGLKALTYMAKKGDGKTPILIAEIAEQENISKKFLEMILLQLKNTGFLGSKKGKGGGYYLLKEPKDITVAALMRVLEGPIAMLPCVSLNFYEKCDDCKTEEECSLNRVMVEVRDNTLRVLENKTLADLTN